MGMYWFEKTYWVNPNCFLFRESDKWPTLKIRPAPGWGNLSIRRSINFLGHTAVDDGVRIWPRQSESYACPRFRSRKITKRAQLLAVWGRKTFQEGKKRGFIISAAHSRVGSHFAGGKGWRERKRKTMRINDFLCLQLKKGKEIVKQIEGGTWMCKEGKS